MSTPEVTRPRRPRTWPQLEGARRKPSEYEVVTHHVSYHFDRSPGPFDLDVSTPVNRWYLRHREGSPLRVPDWNAFRDPRKLTYRGYVEQQSRREAYLDSVVDRYESEARRVALSPEWVALLSRVYLTSRYSCHVLQMAAMYLASMAPSSYVTNCAEFQAADEMRRIQRIAYRAASLGAEYDPALRDPGTARRIWEDDPAWQPLRECLERLLVAYDWGEAFVALNLCVKPAHDAVLIDALADAAGAAGDEELALTLGDFGLDSDRSKQWSDALAAFAVEAEPANAEPIDRWTAAWRPRAEAAVAPLRELLAA
jgi:hypothetical protein